MTRSNNYIRGLVVTLTTKEVVVIKEVVEATREEVLEATKAVVAAIQEAVPMIPLQSNQTHSAVAMRRNGVQRNKILHWQNQTKHSGVKAVSTMSGNQRILKQIRIKPQQQKTRNQIRKNQESIERDLHRQIPHPRMKKIRIRMVVKKKKLIYWN